MYQIKENEHLKIIKAEDYNSIFSKDTGFFMRWGKTKEEDPQMAPGPEILDIEISTVCHGIGQCMDTRKSCPWCYKSNEGTGDNMTLSTFKQVADKLPRTIGQIALGIGDINGNPELFEILQEARDRGIVPNLTVNGMGLTEALAEKLASLCGAISVSRYHIPSVCYDAVKMLTDAGLKQVNIHQLFAKETIPNCYQLLDDIEQDLRLTKLNAVVLLALKPKGNRNKFHSASYYDFKEIFKIALEKKIGIGMDSCSAPMAIQAATELNQPNFLQMIEPCESFGLFSSYINVKGEYFPCSFAEGSQGWEQGINILEIKNFDKEVWHHPAIDNLRNLSLSMTETCDCANKSSCRVCPIFDITPCRRLSPKDSQSILEACEPLKKGDLHASDKSVPDL
jgi:MoaA/NifB/PqqE/SkfB family radical SAM enzyme